jgi:hypothetical protein
MRPVLFLRIASVLTLIHSVLHTVGGVFGKPGPGAAATAYSAMQANRFDVLGNLRSYADFYRGMGLGATITLTIEAVLFWQLASMSKKDGARLRTILWIFVVEYLALAVNSYLYFFMGPVITEILIAGCLGMAIFSTKAVSMPEEQPVH